MANLTKRTVDAAPICDKEYFIWCHGTPGFGVRIYPTGRKVFVAQVRVGAKLVVSTSVTSVHSLSIRRVTKPRRSSARHPTPSGSEGRP